ncbi:MAG: pyridoxal-dependent decarboxylase, partial [Clostridium sp.]
MYNEERKTPYFVIHEKEMKDNLECLKKSLQKYWNNYAIGYSFKTNSVPWLIRFMKQNGCLAEVVSDDEYSLAQKLKYTPNDIIFNGPVKSR